MWFRRPASQPDTHPFPGEPHALNGHAAAYTVERAASDAVVVPSTADFIEITGPLSNLAPDNGHSAADPAAVFHEASDTYRLAAALTGFSLEGLRTSGFASSLAALREGLSAAAGRRVTFVVNLTCRAHARQAVSLDGGHGAYYAAADTGLFQFFATNVQEVADLSLIAHRVAELSLTPGICAQDFLGTSHSVQDVRMPERELIARYLGRSEDSIASPTAAQTVLFGEKRRRIPVLLDPDRPAGIGGVQDRESYFRAVAAQDMFFTTHIAELIDTAMREFAELTGRTYARASAYRVDDADVVVVAQGSVVESLHAVVDHLRGHERIKAGIVNVSTFRPFPGPAIARLLKGKNAVTVLDRTDPALAEDAPLLREVRCALDKAAENGLADDESRPYPEYEPYDRSGDRPPVFSGGYGVGSGLPDFAELAAVFRNMQLRNQGRRRFYVGAVVARGTRRFPHLQSLEQRLRREYPGLGRMSLPTADSAPVQDRAGGALQLYSLSIQGGMFAGNLFAQSLGDALDWSVRTFPEGGLEQSLQPSSVTISYDGEHPAQRSRPEVVDAVLVAGEQLVESAVSRRALRSGGTLIVSSVRSPEAVWRGLSNRAARWIQDESLEVYVIDSRKIAVETATQSSFIDQLAVWALFGAWSKTCSALTGDELAGLVERLRTRLGRVMGPQDYRIDEIARAVDRGTSGPEVVSWETWGGGRRTASEPEPPWTIREMAAGDGTVFDPGRFWHSVGYLYDSGQDCEALTDPHVATGILPAGTSAFRDMTPYRLRIPNWLPENCTACGTCWAQCPETALPPAIQSLSSVVNTAIAQCEQAGTVVVQMKRVGENLAKQAYRIVASSGPRRYTTAGALLKDAFAKLVEKMNLEGDRLDVLTKEFDSVCAVAKDLAIAAPDLFFAGPHKGEKGSGHLLSIAVNPMSCTACGICVEECPEAAMEWADQTEERLHVYHRRWRFQMKLPPVSESLVARYVSDAEPETAVFRMLDNAVYHSMVGGDVSFPGNGAKTAIHLLTAAVESVMRSRYRAHAERLSHLIERLENKIQGEVQAVVKINDFDRFARELGRIKSDGLDGAAFARALASEDGAVEMDPVRVSCLSDLLTALKAQRRRYLEDTDGGGRSRMVLVIEPGGSVFWSGTYPYNPHPHPWVAHLPGDAPALARGVFEGIARRLSEEVRVCRRAALELDDAYEPDVHDAVFRRFDWRELTDEEQALLPPVLIVGRRGSVAWEGVSKLLSAGYPIKIAVVDSYGPWISERTGALPPGPACGSVAVDAPVSVPFEALAQHGTFVLRTTIGYPGHLMRGVARGMARRAGALFHIFAPDPQVSAIAPENAARQARLACRSREIPLVEFDPDRTDPKIVLDGNPDPEDDWVAHELRIQEPSGAEASISVPLTPADWAFKEGRFREHFRVVSKGHRSDQMKPLSEFINLPTDAREGLDPYIEVVDRARRHALAIVSPEMVRATEEASTVWAGLRAAAKARTRRVQAVDLESSVVEPPVPDAAIQPGVDPQAYQKLTERLLWLCGYSKDPDFFRRSLREFVTRDNATGLEE